MPICMDLFFPPMMSWVSRTMYPAHDPHVRVCADEVAKISLELISLLDCLALCVCVCVTVYLPVCLCICISVCLSVRMPALIACLFALCTACLLSLLLTCLSLCIDVSMDLMSCITMYLYIIWLYLHIECVRRYHTCTHGCTCADHNLKPNQRLLWSIICQ